MEYFVSLVGNIAVSSSELNPYGIELYSEGILVTDAGAGYSAVFVVGRDSYGMQD